MRGSSASTDLVEQDDGGRLEDGSRDGDALLLAAAQLQAALTNLSIVAVGKLLDEVRQLRAGCGLSQTACL